MFALTKRGGTGDQQGVDIYRSTGKNSRLSNQLSQKTLPYKTCSLALIGQETRVYMGRMNLNPLPPPPPPFPKFGVISSVMLEK